MKELWKKAKGTDGRYLVSDLGNIKNAKTGYNLKPYKDNKGYLRFSCWDKDRNKSSYKKVHLIVAKTFLDKTEETVNHINGIKTDNRVINLEWCSNAENLKHAYENNIKDNKGEKSGSCKISENEVLLIRKLDKEKTYNRLYISKIFGVKYSLITDVVLRRTWKHI